MTQRNRVLSYTLLLCRILFVLFVIIMMAITIAVVYWHFDPAAFRQVDMTNSFQAGFGLRNFRVYTAQQVPPANSVMLSELSHWMVYWLYLRGLFFMVILLLILRRVVQILRSIHSLRSFYQDNIAHFRAMARYGFIAFIASSINFLYWQGDYTISLHFAWGPLAFALGCLVLAEVFKEGKELLEDHKSII